MCFGVHIINSWNKKNFDLMKEEEWFWPFWMLESRDQTDSQKPWILKKNWNTEISGFTQEMKNNGGLGSPKKNRIKKRMKGWLDCNRVREEREREREREREKQRERERDTDRENNKERERGGRERYRQTSYSTLYY